MSVKVVKSGVTTRFGHVEHITLALAVTSIVSALMWDVLWLDFTPALFLLSRPGVLTSKWVDWTISVWCPIFILYIFWDRLPFSHVIKRGKLFASQLVIDCTHVNFTGTSTLSHLSGPFWVIVPTVPRLVPIIHRYVSLWGKTIINVLLFHWFDCFIPTLSI